VGKAINAVVKFAELLNAQSPFIFLRKRIRDSWFSLNSHVLTNGIPTPLLLNTGMIPKVEEMKPILIPFIVAQSGLPVLLFCFFVLVEKRLCSLSQEGTCKGPL
jgi:hypothetical protein